MRCLNETLGLLGSGIWMFDSQPVVLFWEVIQPRWRMWATWSQLWEFPLTPSFQFAAFALLPVAVGDVFSPLPAPVTCGHTGPAIIDPYLPMLWGSSFFLILPLARHFITAAEKWLMKGIYKPRLAWGTWAHGAWNHSRLETFGWANN